MFLSLLTIADRLRQVPHFQTWDVRDGMSQVSRQGVPAVDLRIEGASVQAESIASARVAPAITVRLIVERGDTAPVDLDQAFRAVIAALHGLRITDSEGRAWSWLKLTAVRDVPVAEGYVGCGLTFMNESEFSGLQRDC